MTGLIAVLAWVGLSTGLGAQPSQQLQEAIHLMETRGDYPAAIRLFQEVAEGSDRQLVAQALLYLGMCYERLDERQALDTYRELVDEFPEESELVEEARSRIAELSPHVASRIEPSMVARRVLDDTEMDLKFGAPFPGGRRFTSPDFETGDLAVYDITTRQLRRLTHKGSWDESQDLAQHSVVSPDGKLVAYAWFEANHDRQELRVIGVDGSSPRILLTSENVRQVRPDAWSADGERILSLISQTDGTHQIAFVAVADGSVTLLKSLGHDSPLETSLSSDGGYVAYDLLQGNGSGDRDVFLLSTENDETTRLVSHPANDVWPTWTPDGSGILFYSNRTAVYGLWLVSVTDGALRGSPVQVRQEMGPASSPLGFTEDGTYYFGMTTGTANVYVASVDRRSGEVTEQPELIDTGYSGANLMPAWASDGSCLAHISMRRELNVLPMSQRLVISCTEDGELRKQKELVPALEFIRFVSWSHDGGSLIAMGRDLEELWGLYRIDAESGETSALIQDPPGLSRVFHPEWFPDGKSIVYTRKTRVPQPEGEEATRRSQIVRRDLDTADEDVLYEVVEPLRLHYFSLSPDGRDVAVTTSDGVGYGLALTVVSLSGDGERRLFVASPSLDIMGKPAWTPDGTEIWLARGTHNLREPRELWRVFVDSGEAEYVGPTRDGLRDLAIHPDGQRVAFITGTLVSRREIWALENFLPR